MVNIKNLLSLANSLPSPDVAMPLFESFRNLANILPPPEVPRK